MAAPALSTIRTVLKDETQHIIQQSILATESASVSVSATTTTLSTSTTMAAQAARQVVHESPVMVARGVGAGTSAGAVGRGQVQGLRSGLGELVSKEVGAGEPSILQSHLQILEQTSSHLPIPGPSTSIPTNTLPLPNTLTNLSHVHPSPSTLLSNLERPRASSPVTNLLTSTSTKTTTSTTRTFTTSTRSTTTTTTQTSSSSSSLANPNAAAEIREAISNALQEGVEEQVDRVEGLVKVGS